MKKKFKILFNSKNTIWLLNKNKYRKLNRNMNID